MADEADFTVSLSKALKRRLASEAARRHVTVGQLVETAVAALLGEPTTPVTQAVPSLALGVLKERLRKRLDPTVDQRDSTSVSEHIGEMILREVARPETAPALSERLKRRLKERP